MKSFRARARETGYGTPDPLPSTTKSRYNALGPWSETPYFGVHTGFHLQGRWGPPPVMVLGEVGGVGGGVWGPGVLAGVLGPLAQGSLMQYKGIWGPGTPGPGVPGPLPGTLFGPLFGALPGGVLGRKCPKSAGISQPPGSRGAQNGSKNDPFWGSQGPPRTPKRVKN